MKHSLKHLTSALLLVALAVGLTPGIASAQEYKETYNQALEAARAKKLEEAHGLFVKAATQASTAGDNEIAKKANYVAAQIDFNLGKKLNDSENHEEALKHFESGIKLDPSYTNNYLGKAVALKGLDRVDDAIATYQALIEVGQSSGNQEAVNSGQSAIRDHYVFLASSALSRNGENTSRRDAEEALGHLTQLQEALDVSEDPDVQYYMAVAHNVMGDYDRAIELANKALELHRGSKTDKAKIYFVLGEAHMFKGNNAAAREAFSNATYGSYKAPAEHYISTLGTN